MPTLYSLRVLCCIITAITIFACNNNGSVVITGGRAYYISPAGNDTNKGTAGEPLRTVQKLNRLPLKPG
ncbi:MAG TPA: hypothetical protein VHB48_13480, partial [Chitinophagaceae bacterium]|nr:hypothetical protein [Chitinophagaceae bacterium]